MSICLQARPVKLGERDSATYRELEAPIEIRKALGRC